MKDSKSTILIIVILILIGAAGYLVFIIQDGSNPLVLLNSQASEGEDPLLAANPTPTITFKSTSPTPTTTIIPSPTGVKTTPTPPIDKLPEATPSPIQQLPVAGFSDWIGYMSLGGGALILLALLL